jgi:hypothetical protein
MLLQLTDADDGHMLVFWATTCWPSGFTMYTAPENGALLVSCCDTASGFAIGSATQKVNDEITRLHGAKNRIVLRIVKDVGRGCRPY